MWPGRGLLHGGGFGAFAMDFRAHFEEDGYRAEQWLGHETGRGAALWGSGSSACGEG